MSLVDVAAQAGLRTPLVYGGLDRKRFIIETNGAGVALVDYDGDGWLDALVLNGTRLARRRRARRTGRPRSRRRPAVSIATVATARSTDVTRRRACAAPAGRLASVPATTTTTDAIDLFVTYYGQNVLYRNLGGGRFEDVTAARRARRGGDPLGLRLHVPRLRP